MTVVGFAVQVFTSALRRVISRLRWESKDWAWWVSTNDPHQPPQWLSPAMINQLDWLYLPSCCCTSEVPKWLHTFSLFGEWVSQLHRTSVTQGFLAGIPLCNSGASIRYFLCMCELHTIIVWVLNVPGTHTSVTKKNCFRIICLIISGLIALLKSGQNFSERLDTSQTPKRAPLKAPMTAAIRVPQRNIPWKCPRNRAGKWSGLTSIA